MAGRPPLRIGQHGKIVRKHLGDGVWLARTRFRDSDGVTRRVERTGSSGPDDKYGLEAENVLIASLQDPRPAAGDEISLDTQKSVCVTSAKRDRYQKLRLSSAVTPKFLPLYPTHVPRQRSLPPYISTLYSGSP